MPGLRHEADFYGQPVRAGEIEKRLASFSKAFFEKGQVGSRKISSSAAPRPSSSETGFFGVASVNGDFSGTLNTVRFPLPSPGRRKKSAPLSTPASSVRCGNEGPRTGG